MNTPKPRYHALDALRGLSVSLMILHHFAIDLVMYGAVPEWLLENPALWIFQPIFASCFVALSGASSRFSRNNLRRGGKILVAAALVSLSTYIAQTFLPDSGSPVFVVFGILHFLGVASILFHFVRPLLDRLKIHGFVWLALFLVVYMYFPRASSLHGLFPLGLMSYGFSSADYYPLLPWIFMYLFGAWAAVPIRENKLPEQFYKLRSPFFEAVSRHSLWIYLLHQPLIIAVFEIYFRLTK